MARFEKDGTGHEVSISIDSILEAEKGDFNFLQTVSHLDTAKFTDWYLLADLVTIDGETLGYRGIMARGFNIGDLGQMLNVCVAELGFTSDQP